MSEASESLGTLVEEVVTLLVDNPDEVKVSSSDDGGRVYIEIECNPDDAGKVIGRQGRIIKSIRTLTRAAASRKDVSVDVELVD